MVLTKFASPRSGWLTTEAILNKLDFNDKEQAIHTIECFFYLDENIGNRILIHWYFTLLYRNTPVYKVDAMQPYDITEASIEPEIKALKTIVTETYDGLKKAYNDKNEELRIPFTIDSISLSKVEQVAIQLKEFLLRLQVL